MSLHISILTHNRIPETIPSKLLIDFGQHTLSLNPAEYGISIFPSTDRIAVYKEVILPDLPNHPQDHVMNLIGMLISAVKIWDEKLALLQHPNEGYDRKDGVHHNSTSPPFYKKGAPPQLKANFSGAFIKKIFSTLLTSPFFY